MDGFYELNAAASDVAAVAAVAAAAAAAAVAAVDDASPAAVVLVFHAAGDEQGVPTVSCAEAADTVSRLQVQALVKVVVHVASVPCCAAMDALIYHPDQAYDGERE